MEFKKKLFYYKKRKRNDQIFSIIFLFFLGNLNKKIKHYIFLVFNTKTWFINLELEKYEKFIIFIA